MARKVSRKQAEREAAKQHQSRLAYIGTLASGIAHEIRTPLNSIGLNIKLMAEDLDAVSPAKREDFERRTKRIEAETERLSKTIDAFLSFARPPKLVRTAVNVNIYLTELVKFYHPEMEAHGIELIPELQENLHPLFIDQHQIAQVVQNLITNAREAIGVQGRIILRTLETDDEVRIEVEDNGGGVNPDDEEKIFEVFFSKKETGNGLGLGIARRIAIEHEGRLELINRPGRGATFVVSLPKVKILGYQDGPSEIATKTIDVDDVTESMENNS